jgi:hypothetical protein
MIAFTYFFVRELPEASTETTLVSSPGTTGPEGTGTDGETPGTTLAETTLDPETQAYLDEVDSINQDLQAQSSELATVNTAFYQDPREIEFPDAENRFEAVQTATADLAARHAGLTPPTALQANHDTLLTAINLASESINQALEGLRSTDTGQQRNSAVDAFGTAAADYNTEVTNTHNVASGGS